MHFCILPGLSDLTLPNIVGEVSKYLFPCNRQLIYWWQILSKYKIFQNFLNHDEKVPKVFRSVCKFQYNEDKY